MNGEHAPAPGRVGGPASSAPASSDAGPGARSDPRIGAEFPVEIASGDLAYPLRGDTRDLGIGGACIATPSPFSFRAVRRVRLALPGRQLDLDAEGRWQRAEHGESTILTGVAFVDPPAEAVSLLWDVVLDGAKMLARFLHGDSDLAHLSVDEAVGIAHASRWRNVPAGRFVYRADAQRSGDASIFLVYRGSVSLQLRVRGATDRTIARLGPGRLFGGLAFVADGLPGECALAESDVRLLEIHEASFRYLCASKPWLAQRIAHAVTQGYARRVVALLGRVGELL